MECRQKIIHVIAEGDTLYKLSKQYDTTVTELIMGNPTANPYNLRVGAKIQVCPGDKYLASVENPEMPPANRPMPPVSRPDMPPANRPMPPINRPDMPPANRPMPPANRPMPPMNRPDMPPVNQPETPAENVNALEELYWDMRQAWLSQIYWVRMYLMSVAAGAADEAQTEERMLETVDEITDVFAEFLPVQAVRRLREMLMRQTELIAAGIRAEKSGESFDYADADSNAEAIAQLFAEINPYFAQRDTENQLLNYLDLTRRQSVEQMEGNYNGSIDVFRDLENETLSMADYFVRGLLAR